jgi:UDP-N-acetylglucosamine transferase subunit ALG13
MIFVTVGNSIKGVEFHRLIRKIDEIAGELKEEVVAQIGFIEERSQHIQCFSYLNYVEILRYFQTASLIIGHCGVGTVINALAFNKPVILVPRSRAYGEHIDDHQYELANKLRGMEGIFVVDDVNDLEKTILEVKRLLEKRNLKPHFSEERARLLSFLKGYVQSAKATLGPGSSGQVSRHVSKHFRLL